MAKGLYKMKIKFGSDTTKPKMDTLMKFKRTIGDTGVQMQKAEKLGLKSAAEDLKARMQKLKEEKLKSKTK